MGIATAVTSLKAALHDTDAAVRITAAGSVLTLLERKVPAAHGRGRK
jgi:hypothetical protein